MQELRRTVNKGWRDDNEAMSQSTPVTEMQVNVSSKRRPVNDFLVLPIYSREDLFRSLSASISYFGSDMRRTSHRDRNFF